MNADEERLRIDDQAALDLLTQQQQAQPQESPAQVGMICTQGSFPTNAQAVYLLTVQTVMAANTEGATATFTPTGEVVGAVNIGSSIPPIGTLLIIRQVDYRKVIRYD